MEAYVTFEAVRHLAARVLGHSLPAFRRQVAEYLAAPPRIEFGDGRHRYVQVDSVEVVPGLVSECYRVGYFLTESPVRTAFEAALGRRPRMRSTADELPGAALYVGGFDSADGFDTARRAFEADARRRYTDTVLTRFVVADESHADGPVSAGGGVSSASAKEAATSV